MLNIRELRIEGKSVLEAAGVPEFSLDAELILSHILDMGRADFILNEDVEVSEEKYNEYKRMLELRSKRIPLQHIIGMSYFYGHEFIVNENVLIPRSETEILVERAAGLLKEDSRVLDICTGSGCIPISLCIENRNKGSFVATDISKEAIEVAKLNAKKHNVNVDFICTDLTLAIPKGQIFDIITSNPPYIKTEDIEGLEPEVRDHDPYIALSGGDDGLIFYKRIASSIRPFLAPNGSLLLEIGYDQARAVEDIFHCAGFKDIEIIKDYAGCDRVVVMKG